jgi:hypothetical protein
MIFHHDDENMVEMRYASGNCALVGERGTDRQSGGQHTRSDGFPRHSYFHSFLSPRKKAAQAHVID